LPPGPHYAERVDIVAYHDLQERPAFKLALQEAGGRWYLYLAHFWHSGWTVLEVTDPAAPRFVRFLEGPSNTFCGQIQVAEGRMLTALEKFIPGWGDDPSNPHFEEGVLVWDVSDPESPEQLSHFRLGATGTHRNFYAGGRYAHLAASVPGYEGNIYVILDLADPRSPREAGRWWVPGQWRAGGEAGAPPHASLHGGAYVHGDRAYLPYTGAGLVILDIADVSAPRLVSRLDFAPPFPAFIALHTAVPLPGRGLLAVNSEAIAEDCDEPVGFAGLVDIRDETASRLISLFPLPVPPAQAPYRNFCERGGRFGPHNQHQPQHQPTLLSDENRVFLTYFNAGLRVVDISDARLPREVGWFVPPDPRVRRGPLPTRLVSQSEDVLVDARGYIYVSDKNHGLYVLRYQER
jgi:hypothetical protein